MIGIFDVAYHGDVAVVGCVTLVTFADSTPTKEWAVEAGPVGPYVPGQFWLRELAPLRLGISSAGALSVCVIDAYVDLGQHRTPGLGRIVHVETGIPVIGVAKTRYAGTPKEYEVLRGSSNRPLYVSSAGIDPEEAKRSVQQMAGGGRVPTMIRRADLRSRRGRHVPEENAGKESKT